MVTPQSRGVNSEKAARLESEERLVLNGIDGVTGQYLIPPMTLREATELARATPPPEKHQAPLRRAAKRMEAGAFATPFGTDENDLSQAGWAVVFTPETPPAVRKALQPLLKQRRKDAGRLFKELEYRPQETREQFLNRYGASGSSVDPEKVPLFLLLVGGPNTIPYDVEFLLNVDYAVGRVAFDQNSDYALYADAVVSYETSKKLPTVRDVVYWGTEHDADEATKLSAQCLIAPLFKGLPKVGAIQAKPAMTQRLNYRSKCFRGADATKANLLEAMHAKKRPSMIFTASHGMGFPKGHAQQLSSQGALLCQDWPGFGSIKPAHYLAAADIEKGTDLSGMVAFLFACYGAGTPQHDPFLKNPGAGPLQVAKSPFASSLAQRLLASGVLSVIGHVERAWTYSIKPSSVGPQLQPFNNLLGRILSGECVGNATVDFSQRYALESVNILRRLDPSLPAAKLPADPELVISWIKRNDAQNYVVLGDPATRLRSDDLK